MTYIHLCMSLIKPHYKVLDVGGHSQPLRRANAVIDINPYETRNQANSFYQGIPERFTRETWVQQDICDHKKPWPFKDKEFDFVVCAQTLEDIRDPLYVCEEMQRVGKAGLIESPSRFYEQVHGFQFKGISGAPHHRWILTENKRGRILFTFKSHDIHRKEYRLMPPLFSRYPHLNPNYESFKFVWKEWFIACEDVEAAVAGNEAFYEETMRLAPKNLWNQNARMINQTYPYKPASHIKFWRGRERSLESLAEEKEFNG